MYLNIGRNRMIRKEQILGIFDLDTSSQSFLTREFLSAAEKAGRVVNAAEDIPNSFLLCEEADGVRVYLSQSSSRTLWKRNDQVL
ncbi:MAG: DUF370 domain-containing protein [Candidatus Limivicinus sp.]|jgi:hypothetical protein